MDSAMLAELLAEILIKLARGERLDGNQYPELRYAVVLHVAELQQTSVGLELQENLQFTITVQEGL